MPLSLVIQVAPSSGALERPGLKRTLTRQQSTVLPTVSRHGVMHGPNPTEIIKQFGRKMVGRKRSSQAVDFDSKKIDVDFESLKATDKERLKLLSYTRGMQPGWLLFSSHLRHTSLPRIAANPIMWLSVLLYITAAVLRRQDIWVTTHNSAAVQGSSLLMTFIIVFFLGYCYNRHYSQYFAAMKVCGSFIEACALSSAYMQRSAEGTRCIDQIYRRAQGLTPAMPTQCLKWIGGH